MNIIICGSSSEGIGLRVAKLLYGRVQLKEITPIFVDKIENDIKQICINSKLSSEELENAIDAYSRAFMPKLETIDFSKIDLSMYFPIEKRSKKNRNRKKWESPYKYHR